VPEGHTIHRLARAHAEEFGGQVVHVTSPQGRFDGGAAAVDGTVLERTDAHGKHLFHGYSSGLWVHVHLGLYGSFTGGPLPAPEPWGALRMRMEGERAWTDLRGPTACELVTPADKAVIHARLGADPLREDADPDVSFRRLSRSRAPIGGLLMDQTVLSGVGNVYRAEILYRHRIEPHRPGRNLRRGEWDALWADLRRLMRAGVRSGRIVTTRPDDRPRRGRSPTREESFYVYRRAGEPCRVCGTPVATEVLAGRNLFWCPTCQVH
jgi:endonuclease VIII